MNKTQIFFYYGHKSLLIVSLKISLARCSEMEKTVLRGGGGLKQELVIFSLLLFSFDNLLGQPFKFICFNIHSFFFNSSNIFFYLF